MEGKELLFFTVLGEKSKQARLSTVVSLSMTAEKQKSIYTLSNRSLEISKPVVFLISSPHASIKRNSSANYLNCQVNYHMNNKVLLH